MRGGFLGRFRRPAALPTRASRCATLFAALLTSACAGDGPPPGIGTTTSTTLVGGGSLLVTLQQTIFTPSCALSGCHDAATRIQLLDLSSAEASYNSLVGVQSLCIKTRVVPSDVAASYLIDKVGGGAPFCGLQMPQTLPALTSQQVQLMRDWIEQGAPPVLGSTAVHAVSTTTSATQPVSTTMSSTSTTSAPRD